MTDDSSDLKQAIFQVSDGVLGAGVLVFLGVLGGNWLDAKLHTAPWLSLACSIIGGGFGLTRLVRKAMAIGALPAGKIQAGGGRKSGSSGGGQPGAGSSESGSKVLPAPGSPGSPESGGSVNQPRSAFERWEDDDN